MNFGIVFSGRQVETRPRQSIPTAGSSQSNLLYSWGMRRSCRPTTSLTGPPPALTLPHPHEYRIGGERKTLHGSVKKVEKRPRSPALGPPRATMAQVPRSASEAAPATDQRPAAG